MQVVLSNLGEKDLSELLGEPNATVNAKKVLSLL